MMADILLVHDASEPVVVEPGERPQSHYKANHPRHMSMQRMAGPFVNRLEGEGETAKAASEPF